MSESSKFHSNMYEELQRLRSSVAILCDAIESTYPYIIDSRIAELKAVVEKARGGQ